MLEGEKTFYVSNCREENSVSYIKTFVLLLNFVNFIIISLEYENNISLNLLFLEGF